jgi:nucleoside-diphosphate-sugar epimerase
MKILITGSSGFIGSNLKDFLNNKGIEVVDYDLKHDPAQDVRDFPLLKETAKGVDGIVHLAAVSRVLWGHEDPLKCVNVNVGGTASALEVCRQAKNPWLIFGSSREVFGEPKELPATERTPRKCINVYGATKVAGEDLCRFFAENYGLKTRVLRFSNVYTGPRDQLDRVTPKFILQAAKNEDLYINGTGQELFDFVYIKDTIQGIWGCIQEIEKSNKLFDDFTLSTGKVTSLEQLAQIIIRATGSNSQIKHAPARDYDVNRFYADPQKAKHFLGYNPKTTLEEGINLAVKKLREQNLL